MAMIASDILYAWRFAQSRQVLDQLRIFVAVAERQYITRAAEALNIVQSGAQRRHSIA